MPTFAGCKQTHVHNSAHGTPGGCCCCWCTLIPLALGSSHALAALRIAVTAATAAAVAVAAAGRVAVAATSAASGGGGWSGIPRIQVLQDAGKVLHRAQQRRVPRQVCLGTHSCKEASVVAGLGWGVSGRQTRTPPHSRRPTRTQLLRPPLDTNMGGQAVFLLAQTLPLAPPHLLQHLEPKRALACGGGLAVVVVVVVVAWHLRDKQLQPIPTTRTLGPRLVLCVGRGRNRHVAPTAAATSRCCRCCCRHGVDVGVSVCVARCEWWCGC